MRFLIAIILILFAQNSGAEVKDCSIERTDNVVLYGQCFKEKEVYIFRSCIDFYCRVNPDLTRRLEKDEASCLKSISDKEFKELALKEHGVKSVELIPYCQYGK